MSSYAPLHNLIHSLTQAEKRYFKVFASQNSAAKAKNYVRLFDAIHKQQIYDEAALKQQFKGQPLAAHFASEKNYLFKLILRAMRAFHARHSPRREIRDLIEDASFLRRKGIYAKAAQALQKAKKLAERQEATDLLLEIYDAQRVILLWQKHKDMEDQLEVLVGRRHHAAKLLAAEKALWNVTDRLFLMARKRYRLRTDAEKAALDALMQADVLQQDRSGWTFAMRQRALIAQANAHQLRGELPEALACYEQNVHQWQASPKNILQSPDIYRRALSNYLSCCHLNGRIDRFPDILAELEGLPIMNRDERGEHLQNLLYYRLLYHLNTGGFAQAVAMETDILALLQDFPTKVNHARRLAFYYNLAVAGFVAEDFSKALRYTRYINDEAKSQHRKDIQQFARVLEMVLHYEMGNHDLMETFFRSVSRFLKLQNGLHPYEALILQEVRRLPEIVSASARRERYRLILNNLKEMQSTTQNGPAPGINELSYWLESRIAGGKVADFVPVYGVG